MLRAEVWQLPPGLQSGRKPCTADNDRPDVAAM
jgi:hypothetical protein